MAFGWVVFGAKKFGSMTLYEIIKALEGVALEQPSVKMIVPNDIYDLNGTPNATYGAFGYVQGQHSASGNFITYAFTLFYVDRLDEDKGNQQFVQSTGILTLANILATLAEVYPVSVDSSTFESFTERFSDECAGVMATVSLTAPRPIICATKH